MRSTSARHCLRTAVYTSCPAVTAVPLGAQELSRIGIDSTVAVDQFAGQNAAGRPNVVIDISAVVNLGKGWQGLRIGACLAAGAEATLGFRLTRDIAVRGSVLNRKPLTATAWDQQAGVSVVWSHRWW